MPGLFRSGHHHKTPLARRFALLALLVLQALVTVAPVMEAHHEAPESHVEQNGATHIFVVHNEATCAVCTLRSIRVLPAQASADVPTAAPAIFAPARVAVSALTRDSAAHASRAPPALA
jgi:hypothetical protein